MTASRDSAERAAEFLRVDAANGRAESIKDVLKAWDNGTLIFGGLPESWPRETECPSCAMSRFVDPIGENLICAPPDLRHKGGGVIAPETGSIPAWGGYRGTKSVPIWHHGPGKIFFCPPSDGVDSAEDKIAVRGIRSAKKERAAEALCVFAALARSAVLSAKDAWSDAMWEEKNRERREYESSGGDHNTAFFLSQNHDMLGWAQNILAEKSDARLENDPGEIEEYFAPVSACAEHQLAAFTDENLNCPHRVASWAEDQRWRWTQELNLGYLDSNICRKHGIPFAFMGICRKLSRLPPHEERQSAVLHQAKWSEESSILPRLAASLSTERRERCV